MSGARFGVDIYSFSQDRRQSEETMNRATMTHKEKCCLFCPGENLFLLLPEHQGAADRRLFAAINMRPVIVAIIPSSLQRPLIVCCPACPVFLRGFFLSRRIVSDNQVWLSNQSYALKLVKRSETVRVAISCIKREGGAWQGRARRACLCNAARTGGNSKRVSCM